MKQFLISLVIGGAVIGGSIAAVHYYNKAQQQKALDGVLTAVQAGDINDMYKACEDFINVVAKSGNFTGIWAGCEGNPGQPVCHDVANGNGCNPLIRPSCSGASGISNTNIPLINIPSVLPSIPEFTPANPNDIKQ